ncbi:MAG: transglycosylase SLT domain-containing protein [Deltaproteobacteria bacterium]|nr:MAG: transglycosylase SLT domain-containing protein [Deltaproteobacteria bacterium]
MFACFFGVVLLLSTPAYCKDLRETRSPYLISSLELPTNLEFCGERTPIEMQEVKERLEKELLLSLWDRPQVILWLKRIPRYMPLIEDMLEQGKLPDDLKYIAIAESALRPHVSSKRGAIGFWQFMRDTGQRYGLTINRYIDERRNVLASTTAAIRYLKYLYEEFGSWTLAAAAYNMGEQGLMAEILEQATNDYYHLYLPLETQRFIFRILSVKLIVSNPERYGFHLSEADRYPPLEFDRINLTCTQDTPIRIIAKAAQTHFKAIKDLNPEIRGHYLAEGSHAISIPKGSAQDFHFRYHELLEQWMASRKEAVYIVKKGDNLSLIADRFNVPLAALIIWNRLDLKAVIHPGDKLIIHRKPTEPEESDEEVTGEREENL